MTEPSQEKIGDLLDSLGVVAETNPGDLVVSAVVLMKVVSAEGVVAVTIASSEGLSWLDQYGLVAAAQDICRGDYRKSVNDDED